MFEEDKINVYYNYFKQQNGKISDVNEYFTRKFDICRLIVWQYYGCESKFVPKPN